MPRPKAYDEDTVLEAAMNVFWRKGYVATAMSDIYAATGLKPGNLYATFTDKETLFRRAFETYAMRFRESLPRHATGLPAIRAWMETQVRLATDDPERKGCLIVNTVIEREAHPAETQALAQARLAEITGFFRLHLQEAKSSGAIAADSEVERGAAALTGAVVAIMSLGRAGADAAMISAVGDAAVAGLFPAQAPVPQAAASGRL